VSELDVVAVGSPLVDVLARATDDDLERTGLVKGSMGLTDLERSDEIYAALGPTVEVSGGSAANTAVGVAALGGRAGFVGKIADDSLGKVFTHDIRAAGVAYEAIIAEGTGEGTGRCLVQVTPDGERTMATHLGAASTIVPSDLPLDMIDRAGILYLEGYLWDVPAAIDAMRTAMERAHANGAAVALSLSDPFCVGRHQRDFLDLLNSDLDVLFGNEEEIVSLFGLDSSDAAVAAAEETGLLVAMTRGAEGSVVVTVGGPVSVPAAPVPEVVDTTGAGDLYAAGFLYGLAAGADPEWCARLGGLCAAEVISHLGARAEHDLRQLATEAGLL
jgi:sugar/nucleoside kinase (ribokinase family)